MALNLGELFGTIGLDSSEWDKKLQGAQGSLKTFGVAGAALAATAAVAIGAALTKGIADSMNIEAGNDKIQAQLGLTEEQAGKAGAAAGSLYAQNYGGSMEEIQVATGAVMSSISGMRTASQADLEDITMKALNLAAAFEVDVAEASASAGQLIKNGLAKDADEAMDLITDAMQGVPASMRGEIFPIMDEYGKHFKTLGIDGTTAFGIVKLAAQDGAIGMDKIGDALKEFTLKAVSTDKPVVEAFESIGLKAGEMQKAMAEGGEVGEAAFAKTVNGLQNIKDPALQAQTAIALFGTPLEDLGTDAIPAFLGQIDPMGDAFDSVAGAADQMNKDLNSNAKAGFDGFVRQADAAMIKFVQDKIMPSVAGFASFLNTDVGPAITKIGDWIDNTALPALRGFGQWFTDNRPVIENFATGIGFILIPLFLRIAISAGVSAAAQVVAWATAGAGAVTTAAIYVAQSYIMIGRWVAMAAASVLNAAIIVGGWVLMGAQSLIQAGRMAAAWFIALGPIGWITAAVIGIAALIIANWDSIVKFTTEAFTNIWNFLQDTWRNIVAGISWLVGQAVALFLRFHPLGMIINNWSSIVGWFSGVWSNITGGISGFISGAVGFFQALPGRILSALGNLGSLLLGAAGQIMSGFLSGLTKGFEDVKNFVGGIGDWIAKNKGPKAYDLALLVPAGGWIMTGLEKGLKAGIPGLKDTLGNVSATIATGVTGGTVGLSGVPGTAPGTATTAGASGGTVNNWHLYEQSDPAATAMNVARRQAALRG